MLTGLHLRICASYSTASASWYHSGTHRAETQDATEVKLDHYHGTRRSSQSGLDETQSESLSVRCLRAWGVEGAGPRQSHRAAAIAASPPAAPVSHFERFEDDSDEAGGGRRRRTRRSFAGIQRVTNAKASDAQRGHRSAVCSSSQSRHSRASCRCISLV
jgi:hypothetical protein